MTQPVGEQVSIPVYMRIGDQSECHIGDLYTRDGLPALLAAAAEYIRTLPVSEDESE